LPPRRWRAITAAPRRYGFHATLKPPFALAPGADESGLRERLSAFASAREAFEARPLAVRAIGGFLALVPRSEDDRIASLAAASVERFDDLRAPPPSAELARRRSAGLSARQDELLRRWGYPYVIDEFRFHMTLTERLDAEERGRICALLERRFSRLAETRLSIDAVAVFVEPAPGARFRELARYPFSR
jgi:hypothetical protein